MLKYLKIFLTGIIVSFGYFPFSFFFLPNLNTKNILAGMGLFLLAFNLGRKRSASIDKDFFILLLFSGIVSLIGLFSTGFNNTSDYGYATYTLSMLIWLSSSYVIISTIRYVHNKASIELVINYLTCVCVVQCILALSISFSPFISNLIDNIQPHVPQSIATENRLHGLGCAVDVGGTRLAAVLILIAGLCSKKIKILSQNKLIIYMIAFLIITIIGSMIARTTMLGTLLALTFWIVSYISANSSIQNAYSRIYKHLTILLIITIPLFIYLFLNNPILEKNLKFAFEGFFSLVEKGTWEVSSNDRLFTMVIFPDNLKTWIIGDGYFDNPLISDYHYIGPGANTIYYMYTDIGYLRFIFYFGVIGTLSFICYMYKAASICMKRFEGYKMMFLFIVLANYIIWCKVATDIFLVFALFLIISPEDYKIEEENDILVEI